MEWLWWLTMLPATIIFGAMWVAAFPPIDDWDDKEDE